MGVDLSSNVTGSCVIGVKSHRKLIRVVLGHFLVNFKVKQNSIKKKPQYLYLNSKIFTEKPKGLFPSNTHYNCFISKGTHVHHMYISFHIIYVYYP